MKSIRLVVAAGLAVAWASGFAQDLRELAFHVVHPAGSRPAIDGALDDACWKKAACHDAYYEYFKEDARRIPEALRTESYLLYDDRGVYLGVRNREPLVKQLKKGHIKNYDTGICLMVCGLDGKEIANRAQVLVADSKTKKVEFQFPFSDRPGEYKVILRDIATGLEAATVVAVAAGKSLK